MNSTSDLGNGSARALKPYPEYKPSGVEWLGMVPAHWETKRLKWVSRLQRGYDLPADRWVPGSFPVVSSGGIIGTHAESKCTGPGVVLGRCGSTDAVFFVERDFWPHNTSLFVTNFYGNNRKWCYYLLNTISKEDHAGKSAVPAVDRKDLFQIIIAVPPLVEQGTVACYIDLVDRLIRRCIQAKEKLVELLEEQRQTLINEAVTGRVDVRTGQPYSEYKPSGVEWLGEVPAHWEVRRLKTGVNNVVNLTSDRRDDEIYLALEHVESWTGRVRSAEPDISFDSQVKQFAPGDVLFGKLRPYLAKVAHPHRSGVCVGEFLVLRPRTSGLDSAYLARFLRSRQTIDAINASTFGAKMPRAEWGFIGSLACPLPPLPEQAAIASYLDRADGHIQRCIHAAQRQIELLNEYRTRLISDVVTGKLDVRGTAAALSERDTFSPASEGDSSTETAATPPSGLDPKPRATRAPA